jgi:hypothetical protein
MNLMPPAVIHGSFTPSRPIYTYRYLYLFIRYNEMEYLGTEAISVPDGKGKKLNI